MTTDKEIEKQRYDSRAEAVLNGKNPDRKRIGSVNVDLPLQAPYRYFESLIRDNLPTPEGRILEIGSGTGAFTSILISSGASVYATDISDLSLNVLQKNFDSPLNLKIMVSDMEELPFEDESFDLVTNAGSLSYGDNQVVMNEIFRVLKLGGLFIAVDSLNHNFIYRLNRYIHYLRGKRTLSTLKRMPRTDLIEMYAERFGSNDVRYFGSISWMMPFLKSLFNENKLAELSEFVDKLISVKTSAFKFVMMVRKKNEK